MALVSKGGGTKSTGVLGGGADARPNRIFGSTVNDKSDSSDSLDNNTTENTTLSIEQLCQQYDIPVAIGKQVSLTAGPSDISFLSAFCDMNGTLAMISVPNFMRTSYMRRPNQYVYAIIRLVFLCLSGQKTRPGIPYCCMPYYF